MSMALLRCRAESSKWSARLLQRGLVPGCSWQFKITVRKTSTAQLKANLEKQRLIVKVNIDKSRTLKIANLTPVQLKAISTRVSEMMKWR